MGSQLSSRRWLLFAAAIIALVATVSAAGFALSDDEERTELRPSALTLEQLYAMVDERLKQEREVLYIVAESSITLGYDSTLERWLYPSETVIREQSSLAGPTVPDEARDSAPRLITQ